MQRPDEQVAGRASRLFYTRSMTDIAALRKSYELAELDESASDADPLRQFESWLEQAIAGQIPEPNAMTLATVGADGRPSTRIVLVKGIGPEGIVWFTNYESRKGREIAVHPFAALQFHWVELERVVRIEGAVEKVADAESDAYSASRPLDCTWMTARWITRWKPAVGLASSPSSTTRLFSSTSR